MTEKIATLEDLLGKDLSRYRLGFGHWLELKINVMYRVPALHADTRQMVIAADEETLKRIEESLPKEGFIRRSLLGLIDISGQQFFSLEGSAESRLECKPLPLITRDNIASYFNKSPTPFKWAA